MKLHKITLYNFRQFFGKQEIYISTDEKKNVTIVHAENGFGKTTILNSILWCLYGITTDKFEKKDDIINYDSISLGEKTAYVELQFEYEEDIYFCKREVKLGRENKPIISINTLKDGSIKDITKNREPKLFLNSVLPETMARYFFLDGEQTEALSSEFNRREVGKAIRAMMGCDTSEDLISDLEYLSKKYDEAIRDVPGDELIQEKERELTKLIDNRDHIESQLETSQENLKVIETQVAELDRELAENQNTSEYQLERLAQEKERSIQKEMKENLRGRKRDWFVSHGQYLVSEKIANEIERYFDSTKSETDLTGSIPSPYNEEFVRSLIEKEECICGRPLNRGTSEWECVLDLTNQAPSSQMQRKAIQAKSFPILSKTKLNDSKRTFLDIEEDLLACDEKIRDRSARIEELEELLANIDVDDMAYKEARRTELKHDADKILERIEGLKIDIAVKDHDIKQYKKEIDRLSVDNSVIQPLTLKRNLCDELVVTLKAILEIYIKEAKEEMETNINTILDETAHKDYAMSIGDDFSLELRFRDGRPAPKSTGENQLLSLAFLSALVAFADRRSKETDVLMRPGTNAPLVLDSPFGYLDDNYQQSTANFVPNMAMQVVILISSSQGSDEFLEVLEDKIGKEYLLILETTDDDDSNNSKDWASIHGTKRKVIKRGQKRNATAVSELEIS